MPALLWVAPLQAETIFAYFGEEQISFEGENLPTVVEGELGQLRELEFREGSDASGAEWAQYIEIPLPEGDLNELTIAFFLKPQRRDRNEDLVTCKWDTGNTGFRLSKSWNQWLFSLGNGEETARVQAASRDAALAMDEWQHLAITFKEGRVRFYKDAILLHEETVPVSFIRRESPLRIGAGLGRAYAFSGRMAGIHVAAEALDDAGILALMQKANP
ncbi:MAG TPA: LamG domain-containing protein [Chthoniobacteraceae bacterium]|nr:LamG domain-containing protein [Chthoniobacteraceae bacterium]